MSWLVCDFDNDYQIYSEYPFNIRKMNSENDIKEAIDDHGYIYVCIKRKAIRKHRIVAIQFIPNPDNLPQVDHINHDKTDYHINNLRWCDNATNQQNCGSTRGVKHEFFDEIPCDDESEIIPVTQYNDYTFENLYYYNNYFYYYNGFNYKRANVNYDNKGHAYINAVNTNGVHRRISYLKFKKLYELL